MEKKLLQKRTWWNDWLEKWNGAKKYYFIVGKQYLEGRYRAELSKLLFFMPKNWYDVSIMDICMKRDNASNFSEHFVIDGYAKRTPILEQIHTLRWIAPISTLTTRITE